MNILDTDTVDSIQETIGEITGDLWQVPVSFDGLAEPILGQVKEKSAEYVRETYGDEYQRVVACRFEQQLWLSKGGDAVEEGQKATYGSVVFEVKGIVNAGMLKDRFLFIDLELVR